MKRVNAYWLVGIIWLLLIDNEHFPLWADLIRVALLGALAMLFTESIQNAIDHRKDRQ